MTRAESAYFVHPTALVETMDVGEGTRIWAFTHIQPSVSLGSNCNIGDHCYIEAGVSIGDDVVIKNGVSVWRGVAIGARTFVGPNVTFTNDRSPRAKAYRAEYDRTYVEEGASLGANATILCGIRIGRYALVGAGSVVTKSVPDYGLVAGNPARLRGHVCRCGQGLRFVGQDAPCVCGRCYKSIGLVVEEIKC